MQSVTTESAPLFTDADLISVYTRAEAIADGMLIDVSSPARALGVRFPLAVTARVWSELVDYDGSDVAWSLRSLLCVVVAQLRRAKAAGVEGDRLEFKAFRKGRLVDVYLHVGPGDEGEPVLTLLLAGED